MKVGIIGGAGYTAGELIRLLVHHPQVTLTTITSKSQDGLPVSDIHKDLIGDVDMNFTTQLNGHEDLIFLCQGHGLSSAYFDKHPEVLDKMVIDLSTDFRPRDNALGFEYGLPELNKETIKKAKNIANPGCFATAIQLAFLPLAHHQLLQSELHITGITGSTGAGQQPRATTHFSWRNNNLSIYKLFSHQHLAELTESLSQVQVDYNQPINFVPMRGDFPRGIYISAYTDCHLSEAELLKMYTSYYSEAPFTIVTTNEVSLKEVVNTNKCLLKITKQGNKVHFSSLIDNLLKGASGQAVQNMNLMMGWDETLGLKLKSIAF